MRFNINGIWLEIVFSGVLRQFPNTPNGYKQMSKAWVNWRTQ